MLRFVGLPLGVFHCTRNLPALRLLTRSDRFVFFIRSVQGRWGRCFARTTRSASGWSRSSCSTSTCRLKKGTSWSPSFERLIAADLTHPALAAPLATGITGVSAFLAQDYVAAESLDLSVREYGPAPPAEALRVAAQLAGALDFAAVVDISHGALHPRDVLMSSDDTRLTGMGVAHALETRRRDGAGAQAVHAAGTNCRRRVGPSGRCLQPRRADARTAVGAACVGHGRSGS